MSLYSESNLPVGADVFPLERLPVEHLGRFYSGLACGVVEIVKDSWSTSRGYAPPLHPCLLRLHLKRRLWCRPCSSANLRLPRLGALCLETDRHIIGKPFDTATAEGSTCS